MKTKKAAAVKKHRAKPPLRNGDQSEPKPEPVAKPVETGNGHDDAEPRPYRDTDGAINFDVTPEEDGRWQVRHATEQFVAWGNKLVAMGLIDGTAWYAFRETQDLDNVATHHVTPTEAPAEPAETTSGPTEEPVAACTKQTKKTKATSSKQQQRKAA